MYRFEKLEVWQKSMDFCELVYKRSSNFPKTETYGPVSQLRRAATSIPLNIAEGSACRTKKEFIQFLTIALRSQCTVSYLTIGCHFPHSCIYSYTIFLITMLYYQRFLNYLLGIINSKIVFLIFKGHAFQNPQCNTYRY
jgi:hypothetical protein